MHTVIGNFYKCTHPLIKVKGSSPVTLDLWKILTISIYSYFSRNMLIQHDDIELNPVQVQLSGYFRFTEDLNNIYLQLF